MTLRPYSEEALNEIECDPVRLRAYFWRVAMSARYRAKRKREKVNLQAVYSSPVGFDDAAIDARDELRSANVLDNFAQALLDNLDAFVESSLALQTKTLPNAEAPDG